MSHVSCLTSTVISKIGPPLQILCKFTPFLNEVVLQRMLFSLKGTCTPTYLGSEVHIFNKNITQLPKIHPPLSLMSQKYCRLLLTFVYSIRLNSLT